MTISDETIRRKAYQLWELRGCPTGSAEADWYAAEHLLLEDREPARESPPVQQTPRYGLRRLTHE